MCDEIRDRFKVKLPDDLALGGIVGTATLADCVTSYSSPFFSGPFGFVMEDARFVKFQECDGALGIFRL
ncbi:MAG: hypothetical protein Q7S40_19320 [Opitutaceae bacterium]|nr:hypothetical protein [Opitutaceae bacterium]